jgi:hypothetical protein
VQGPAPPAAIDWFDQIHKIYQVRFKPTLSNTPHKQTPNKQIAGNGRPSMILQANYARLMLLTIFILKLDMLFTFDPER